MDNPILDPGITPAQVEKIEFTSDGRSKQQIAEALVKAWRDSPCRKDMIMAGLYYKCRNAEIANKSRSYTDARGELQINNTLSNVKIPSAFLRSNVQQKVNYAFGKPMVVTVDSEDEVDEELKKEYAKLWQDFLNENQGTIKKTVTNAIAKGIGWQYVTILDGKLKITDIDPEELYPDWTDKNHEELLGIARDYVVIEYSQGNVATDVHHVDFYDKSELTPFLDKNGTGSLTPHGDPTPYLKLEDGDNSVGIGWENVPFVALKGTDDEVPMLNIIKEAIDTYDKLVSKASDSILDDTDPLLVLTGYDSQEETLRVVRDQLKTNKIVSVGKDGDVKYITVNVNVEAVHKHLEVLKKQIQYDGQMVDTQDVQFGSNLSGVALQSLYSNMDIYINGLETETRAWMRSLKPFFDAVLQFQGNGTVEQWERLNPICTLNRDMLINLAADIESTVKLASTGVSQQTIDDFNPVVQSHETEEERRQAERDAAQGGDDDPVFLQEVETAAQRLIEQREGEGAE